MKKGFTLLELIIVVIILGVLASVALPLYFNAVERGRSAEAINFLGSMRGSQLRYAAERGVYTTNYNLLDVDMIVNSGRFSPTPLAAVVNPTTTGNIIIAQITRRANPTAQNPFYGTYTLSIREDGTILCSGGSGIACQRIGY